MLSKQAVQKLDVELISRSEVSWELGNIVRLKSQTGQQLC